MRLSAVLMLTVIGLIASSVADATTIIEIRTAAEVVLAADSAGTFSGNAPESVREVCKIYRVNDAVFAVSGPERDRATGFDVPRIVAQSLQKGRALSEILSELREHLQRELEEELPRVRA